VCVIASEGQNEVQEGLAGEEGDENGDPVQAAGAHRGEGEGKQDGQSHGDGGTEEVDGP